MKAMQHLFQSLDTSVPIWDSTFMVAPLVLIGTKEADNYDMAPKHMAGPVGFDNYFGFVCTPKHATYHNVLKTKFFTVSFPLPDTIVATSLAASQRDTVISKYKNVLKALPLEKAQTMDAMFLKDSYLRLECELFKVIDGFGENSIITGKIKVAQVLDEYRRISERDEQDQLVKDPLFVYISPGRFAKITKTYNFPFPKDFKR
ncbi:hypothetical protein DKG77_06160 [Flagellimonas aquimarina]|uniref:Flavin reductase like domain-containing protein n=2 Tax=Flagellimonas aquimarina TaxID=2201895 RepID=A0A316L3I2_9FLAO|nr:hypothetical protein DKG77_06160 [Allomuricauda koreensis]